MIEYLILFTVAILAGLVWTLFGYFVDWRKNHNNPDWEGFSFAKMRNDAILGLVLGGVAGIAILGGFVEMPVVDSVQSFINAFPGLFAAIVTVDKFIVGGVLGRQA